MWAYAFLFKNFGRLPNEIDEEHPLEFMRVLNYLLNEAEKEVAPKKGCEDIEMEQIPAAYRMFYGG